MTIVTDRCNFSSLSDVLADMECEGYNTITIKDAYAFGNSIRLGGVIGIVSKKVIEHIIYDEKHNIDGLYY